MTQKKLVVAYDGSHNSENALKLAGEIAKGFGAEILLVTVIANDYHSSRREIGPIDLHQMQQANEMHWREISESGAKQALEWGISVKVVLLTGEPAGTLLSYAEKEAADMIVVGPRGLGTFESLLLGSITQKILSHSTISVIVAK